MPSAYLGPSFGFFAGNNEGTGDLLARASTRRLHGFSLRNPPQCGRAVSTNLLYILGGEGESETLQELSGSFGRGFGECGSEGCKGRKLLKLLVSEREGKVARDARCARVICESQSG